MLDDHLEFLAADSSISTIAMGQKNVNMFLKEKRIGEREVLKSQEFLKIWMYFNYREFHNININ